MKAMPVPMPMSERAAQLRRDFDRGFAEPQRLRRAASVDLLAVRVGGDAYALRLSAVAGLFADKKITRLPGTAPQCLGIAGFRGSVVPVYDLRVLLGHPGGDMPRWLVVAAADPVALAFDGFDGYLRLPFECIAQQDGNAPGRAHVRELARASDGALRSLVDLDSVLVSIRRHLPRDVPVQRKE